MPLQTVGTKTYDGDKEVEKGAASHREAAAAAAERSVKSSKKSAALAQTVNREIAMDFADAKPYAEVGSGRRALMKQATEDLRHGSKNCPAGSYFGLWEDTREALVVKESEFAERFISDDAQGGS